MIVGDRLRSIREEKQLTQGDIEERCGLRRCYVSRVENGHTVPSVETLEKLARALGVPLHYVFYDGEQPPAPALPAVKRAGLWGSDGKDARLLALFRKAFAGMDDADRDLLAHTARKMVRGSRRVRQAA